MSPKRRVPFVALESLVSKRFNDLDDVLEAITKGEVLVDGSVALNPRALVRADAAIKLRQRRTLRGTRKLARAVDAFRLDLRGLTALDLGAAAGGFTQALLDAGVARVYAVDAGIGQLRGSLRADPRVVNMERTNLGSLTRHVIPEPVEVLTMDLSYLSIADALPQLERLELTTGAHLIALVKPTFELHTALLAAGPDQVSEAVRRVGRVLERHGWDGFQQVESPVTGSRGAIEVLVHARRRGRRAVPS